MNIEFQRPWFLLILIPLIALTVLPFLKVLKKKRGSGRHTASFVLRIISMILAAAILSGFTAVRKTDRKSLIIVADMSDSTRNVHKLYEQYISEAAKYAGKNTEIGLITFGYDSFYEIPLSEKFSFSGFETKPAGNYTDMYSAVVKAAAMMPAESDKRIILLTDGKENIGRIKDAASVLLQRNIRFDAFITETENAQNEIQLTAVNVPETVYSGETFNITVTAESLYEGEAELSLYSDNVLCEKRNVRVTKGTNRFVFKETASASGISSYSAEIKAPGDSLGKNNKVYSFIKSLGKPKILIVDGTGSESHELVKIIGDTADVDVVRENTVPTDIAGLRKYNSVILMNTSKVNLPENWDSLLDVYVRQLGRGLLTTGGTKAYGLGGWTGTKMEEILPVNMQATDERKLADIAMMLLIDNSGSMGGGAGSPLELAKQGAINSVGELKDIDEAGVIAFSDNAVWIAKMTPGKDKGKIQQLIGGIGPGGGTMLYSSLEEAIKALDKSEKSLKSIILLTDGQPADESQIRTVRMAERLSEKGITVTSIAVGEYLETSVLDYLSEGTGGSVCKVKDVNTLPQVIFTETEKVMKNGYVINKTFNPAVVDYSSVLSGVGGIPEIDGYVLTEIKDMAYNILADEDGEPVLASWQYGLGKAASLTTDLNGKWSSKLLQSESGRTLLSNTLSWILPSDDNDGGSAEMSREGDKGVIKAVSPVSDVSYKTEATVISPSGKETNIELSQTGLGEYGGEFFLEEEGSYVAVVTQKDSEGNVIMNKESGLAVKYSDEYDMLSRNTGTVAAACRETGGSAEWTVFGDVMKVKTEAVRERLTFTVPFLIAILCLLLADIALRRLDVSLLFAGLNKKKQEKEKVKNQEKNKEKQPFASVKQMKEKKDRVPDFAQADSDASAGTKDKKKEPSKQQNNSQPQRKNAAADLLKEKQNIQRKKL